MTQGPHDGQKLDVQLLDSGQDDSIARPSLVEQITWMLKIKGFGLSLQFEQKKKSWLRLER